MAPQTETTRVVIVRPTRDGDHIIINVTFSKLNTSLLGWILGKQSKQMIFNYIYSHSVSDGC